MTDLEMTKLCAEAMGELSQCHEEERFDGRVVLFHRVWRREYDPLHDDAQVTALVKAFSLTVDHFYNGDWTVAENDSSGVSADDPDYNRAVVGCVAKMMKDKP